MLADGREALVTARVETDGVGRSPCCWRSLFAPSGLGGTSSSNEGNDYIRAENEREDPAEQAHVGRKTENEQNDCDDGDASQDVTGWVEHHSPP
jgi:hypothetical protein